MIMKKIMFLIFTAIIMLSMVSCGNRATKVETTEDTVEVVDSLAVADTTAVADTVVAE